jgi:1-acyl-sn-glycerol-3-phosphate acyltransferase
VWAWGVLLVCLIVGWVAWRRSGRLLDEFVCLGLIDAYSRFVHRCSFVGAENIPVTGPVLLMANHTCSADPAFLSAACPRVIGFLLAEEYYASVPVLHLLFQRMGCVPVRRDGRDVPTVRRALARLSSGQVLGIFPEGGLSNAGRGSPRRGKAGVAYLALRSGVPVVPAMIQGGPQTDDIATAWLCPFPSRVKVIIGPPVDLSRYLGKRIDRKLIEEAMTVLTRALLHLNQPAAKGRKHR